MPAMATFYELWKIDSDVKSRPRSAWRKAAKGTRRGPRRQAVAWCL